VALVPPLQPRRVGSVMQGSGGLADGELNTGQPPIIMVLIDNINIINALRNIRVRWFMESIIACLFF